MKKTFGLGFLCLALVLSVLLSACGGGGGTPAATTQQQQQQTQQQQQQTQQQQTSTAESPYSDIPIYPGAEDAFGEFSEFTGGIASVPDASIEWHYYQVDESDPDNIMDFYKSQMPDNGWEFIIEASVPEMGGSYAMYMKGTSTATIMAFEDPEGTYGMILAICKTSM